MKILPYLQNRPNIFISVGILIVSIVLLWHSLPGIKTYQSDLAANQIYEGTVVSVLAEKAIEPLPGRQNTKEQSLLVDVDVNGIIKRAIVENDLMQLRERESIYVRGTDVGKAEEAFNIVDIKRQHGLAWLAIFFVVIAIGVGGRKGLQALIGLVFSIMIIFALIIPQILAGHSPVLIGLLGSLAIVVMNVYLTDGMNRKSIAALAGIVLTLAFTAVLTLFVVHKLHFTGYSGEDSFYLTQNSAVPINLVGVLIAGIGLSALGVLADVAITQVSTVFVLAREHRDPTRRQLFTHAMEVGHDHIAAVINTLALAYIGASLPLLLLLSVQKFAIGYTINIEDIATEIIRILISTSGLVLVVPITTLVAVLWATRSHSQNP